MSRLSAQSRSWCYRLMVVSLLVCGSLVTARAMLLPHWPIDYVVFKSELILQGHFIDQEHFFVDKVLFGAATPLQTILITDRLNLSRIANDPERNCDPIPETNRFTGKPCLSVKQEAAVVFLQRIEGNWEPIAWGSGVKWLLDGKVLGYYQFNNPGPYILISDSETKTAEDLYGAIERSLEKRARFEAALQKTPKERIKRLLPFLEDTKQYLYWRDAVHSLAATGSPAGAAMRELAEKLKGEYQRIEVLKAMGETGDKDLTLYLRAVVATTKPVSRMLESETLTAGKRQSTEEWLASLCSMAKLSDSRSLPVLRESLFDSLAVGEFYGPQARTCIEEGLKKMRSRENLVAFAKVYALSPRDYKWGATKWAGWGVLNFLTEHRFPEAIPLLTEQLDHPDNLFRAEVHKILTSIVGRDLGVDKGPWLDWYEEFQPLRQLSVDKRQ